MGFFDFGWKKSLSDQGSMLPQIFPFPIMQSVFVRSDMLSTYSKILTDTIDRTFGIPKNIEPLLWDNCVQSEANLGLITLLSQAMADQADLYLVYSPSVKVLRKANADEERKIREDYERSGRSTSGVFISFKKYRRSEMLNIYSNFEYCVLSSLHKTLNLSKAIQLKINDLRKSVAVVDSSIAISQAHEVARALGLGGDVVLDVKDMIETANPDTSSTEKAIDFLDAKRAYILGLPLSYISGEQTTGIGSTGEADMRAVERGLKQYFLSIIQPSMKAIFGVEVEFKSQDFRQLATALEALKTFDLVSEENLSRESKQELISRMLDLDLRKERRLIEKGTSENEQPEAEESDIGFPREN